jgi:spore coat polysaccharide biosynthesis predicted glycosyltransferase SpsG/GTP:adenosylcobinamide-phosphate guanylyltransferase
MGLGRVPDLVVVIPARGGSKRIKGKNIRPLAGKPLVHHAIEYALELEPKTIIVSTDSDEVAGVVRTRYPDVQIDRSFDHTDATTVDDVTKHIKYNFLHYGETLVTIQPTMIGDVVDNVNDMLAFLQQGDDWVRCSGLRAVKGKFISWGDLHPINTSRLIDIDTMGDFAQAESFLRKQTAITIVYKAGEKQGWGHELRAKTLADALQDYDVWLCPLEAWNDPIVGTPDVLICDVGDTTETFFDHLISSSKVITIEDNGPGARLAHASINPFNDLKYAVLRPEFYNLPEYVVRENVDSVLLSFGGQDNHGMSEHVYHSLRENNHGWESWVLNLISQPQPGQMAAQMLKADLLICAGGQTSVEAIKVGVPTIVIPALPTEAMRPHLKDSFINLGITPSSSDIWAAVLRVIGDKMLREDMSNRMKATRVGDGALEIRRIVEDLCQR